MILYINFLYIKFLFDYQYNILKKNTKTEMEMKLFYIVLLMKK